MGDPVGLAIGVVGLASQLYQASMACYEIFSDVQDVGRDHDSFHWQLVTEQNRLMRWEKTWGVDSGTLTQRLNPSDYQYRYAVGTLARIVALFASSEQLDSKYGLQTVEDPERPPSPEQKLVKKNGGSFFRKSKSPLPSPNTSRSDRVWDIFPFLNLRSRDGEEAGLGPSSAGPMSDNPPPYSPLPPIIDTDSLKLLENPSVLQSRGLVLGLNEEIKKLQETATRMQKSLPIYQKLKWAVRDKKRSIELIKQLRTYNDGLYNVLPALDTRTQEQFRTCKNLLISKRANQTTSDIFPLLTLMMNSPFFPVSEIQTPYLFTRGKKPPIQWKGRFTGKYTQYIGIK